MRAKPQYLTHSLISLYVFFFLRPSISLSFPSTALLSVLPGTFVSDLGTTTSFRVTHLNVMHHLAHTIIRAELLAFQCGVRHFMHITACNEEKYRTADGVIAVVIGGNNHRNSVHCLGNFRECIYATNTCPTE